jgi:hypothetical protein
MINRSRGNKYGNKKVVTDGIKFDSKRESDVYLSLKSMQDRDIISNLELQPKYELIPPIKEQYIKHLKTKDKICFRTVQLAITYTADFKFTKGDNEYVIDVKASPYMLPKEYSLKVKMMRYIHGITVIPIYKLSDLKQWED